jgi:hypothetical protein
MFCLINVTLILTQHLKSIAIFPSRSRPTPQISIWDPERCTHRIIISWSHHPMRILTQPSQSAFSTDLLEGYSLGSLSSVSHLSLSILLNPSKPLQTASNTLCWNHFEQPLYQKLHDGSIPNRLSSSTIFSTHRPSQKLNFLRKSRSGTRPRSHGDARPLPILFLSRRLMREFVNWWLILFFPVLYSPHRLSVPPFLSR